MLQACDLSFVLLYWFQSCMTISWLTRTCSYSKHSAFRLSGVALCYIGKAAILLYYADEATKTNSNASEVIRALCQPPECH